MMWKRKGQIMFFIVAGIVILFILYLIYVVADYSFLGEGPDVVTLSKTSDEYIRSCISHGSKEALRLAGMQGGVIFDYQTDRGKRYLGPPFHYYGEYVLPVEVDGVMYNVSYGIVNAEYDESYHPAPPSYPYGDLRLVSDPSLLDPGYVNIFGNYPLPGPFTPLCDYNGLNSHDSVGMEHSCETYDSPNPNVHNSVQEFIEDYIRHSAYQCFMDGIDDGSLPELENVSLNMSQVNVSTLITNNELIVWFDFPAELTVGSNILRMGEQKLVFQTRLKLIHELASHLIERDVNDIFFDMVRDADELGDCRMWANTDNKCLKKNIHVSKIRDPLLYMDGISHDDGSQFDDIFVITDEDSRYSLNGEPYRFNFAIENRPPALDFMFQSMDSLAKGFNFIVFAGDELNIDPEGYDPDEELYVGGMMAGHYHYSRWKETYDDVYDYMFCNPDASTYGECLADPWKQSRKVMVEVPHNWTNSEKYKSTRRNASIMVDKDDRGAHQLKVEVCDEGGLCDSQLLNILVLCDSCDVSDDPQTDFSDIEYGCRDDPGFAVHSGNPDPVFHGEDALTDAQKNNAVYKRVYEVLCSDDGDCIRTDNRYVVDVCSGCMTCSYGSFSCVPGTAYDDVCNAEWKCSDGPMQEYGSGGRYLCQASCDGSGVCDTAVNCKCDISCGSGCTDGSYEWDGDVCRNTCSLGSGCSFQRTDTTMCSAPSFDGSSSDIVIDGATYRVGQESDGMIKGESDYASYCVRNNRCMISVCSSDGSKNIEKDACYPPGRVGDVCYTEGSPKCSPDGSCLTAVSKPIPSGNDCYYNFECDPSNPLGWTYSTDSAKPASGAWVDGANTDICHFGEPICTSSIGWQKPASLNNCDGHAICTNAGWVCG